MSLTDKIFGREELKEEIRSLRMKIQKLEDEKQGLEEKLDKEDERAKEAISTKQGLEEKINKQEDKIKSLEDKIRKKDYVKETLEKDVEKNKISRKELSSILTKLGTMESDKEDLLSVFLPPEDSVRDLDAESMIQANLTLNQLKRLKEEKSETGKVVFYSKDLLSILIKPPLLVKEDRWKKSTEFKLSPLEKQLDSKVGYIFLSAGGSALAIFGEEVEKSEVLEADIKGKHKKGGFSQGRFERRRGEEIKSHLKEVGEAAEEFFDEEVDIFALTGSNEMRGKFRDGDFLEDRDFFEMGSDISRIEDESDLEKAFTSLWKSEKIML